MSDKIRLTFDKKWFDRLCHYLSWYDDGDRIQKKIRAYGHVTKNQDGEEEISIGLFPDDVRLIAYRMLGILPQPDESHQYFEEYVKEIKERERFYQEEKERKERELCSAIRELLMENPDMQGAEIARILGIGRSAVYERWNKIKEELNRSAE